MATPNTADPASCAHADPRLPSFGMAQGRSGVQALFGCGLGRKAAPKAALWQLKKTRMAVPQNNGWFFLKVFCFAAQPSLPAHIPFFFKCLRSAFVTSFALGLYFLFPAGLWKKAHNQKVLARSVAAFFPCGGTMVAAMPLVRARLVPRQAPPHPHTPGAGALADARVG